MNPEPRSSASFTLSTEQPAAGDVFTGKLGSDSVEGGCAYLLSGDGTRYEVIYPDGWRVQLSPLQLIDPGGAVVATASDEVTVRGALADDMASTCQIGPIFRATEVDR